MVLAAWIFKVGVNTRSRATRPDWFGAVGTCQSSYVTVIAIGAVLEVVKLGNGSQYCQVDVEYVRDTSVVRQVQLALDDGDVI